MKNRVKVSFGGVFWPSLIASLVVIFVIGILLSIIIGSLVGSKPVYSTGKDAVLHMKMRGQIKEVSDSDFDPMAFEIKSSLGLSEILYGFERAKNDDNIKGVFMEIGTPQCGYAKAFEIRKAIQSFSESGKFVVAYLQGEAITLKQYFIASAANEIYGFPTSMFQFMGMGAELMFYKGMFDKLDLEMQIIRGPENHFKSAVEPYFLEKMSDSSRVQVNRYLTSMWEDVKQEISDVRGVDVEELDNIADNAKIRRLSDAVTHGLIDEVKYRDEVISLIQEKVGAEESDDINFKGFEKYASKKFNNNNKILKNKKQNIAVILSEGGVVKKGDGLSSDKITKHFKEAREDDDIKAVVFRINSPGGSALASDEIWREVVLTKKKKPVYVSMGDVAASGGYYVAAPANKIFAETTTITGSIGVFGVIPYTGAMLENKLGISFDRVETNKRAVLSTNRKLSEEDMAIVQEEVGFIYNDFIQKVADGRNLSEEEVHTIARGRVWTGKDAKRIGLVDDLGTITDVIHYAATDNDIDSSDIALKYFPEKKVEPWMELLEAFNEENDSKANSGIPQELVEYYNKLRRIDSYVGIQARLPYDIEIE